MSKILSLDYVTKAINNSLINEKCADLHAGLTCNQKFIFQVEKGFQGVYKMYLFVHIIPFILFKVKKTRKQPKKELLKLLFGFIRSLCFGSLYCAILRRTICFMTKYHKFDGNLLATIPGFVGGISLIFQSPARQCQIALFTLNKAMESVYGMAKRRNYPVHIPQGQILVMGIATSIMAYFYMNQRQSFKSSYLSVLDQMLGKI